MGKIPIVFGVTGHRDLREQDISELKNSVRTLFNEYREQYPHIEFVVVSALAEGADMLVADVALELGLTLHVLIPYQEEEYLNSFMDKEKNSKEYFRLKSKAKRFDINSCVHTFGAENCYAQLGEKIADISNILLALWDGVDNGKAGGTSAIVKYQREGINENRFDAMDGNAIFIITTPRASNPDIQTDFRVQKECLGKHVRGEEFDKMLKKIDKVNQKIDIQPSNNESITQKYIKYFDNLANAKRDQFKLYSIILLVLTAFAFISLESMDLFHNENLVIGYGIFLLLAFAVYGFFMKNGKLQDDFVFSRGFVEAFRVQKAWIGADINDSVAKYYLKDQHHKYTWIKVILKNLFYKDTKPPSTKPIDWIDGQIVYFKKASKIRDNNLHSLERIEKFFYTIGVLALFLMFVSYLIDFFHLSNLLFKVGAKDINLGTALEKVRLLKENHEHGYHLNWHIFVWLSGVALLIAAFIGEKYIKIAGYEDDIYHFNAMLADFQKAKGALTATNKGSDEYKKIVYDLGVKALEENSKWVVLHNSMRAKPSLE